MCSKTTSSESYGDDDDYYFGLCPKKHKHKPNNNNNKNGTRRRVPRRGPGVAELEKIRLRQQHNNSSASPLPSPPAIIAERTGSVYTSYFKTGSFSNDLIPPAPVFQRNQDSSLHYLPRMDLPKVEYGGFYEFIEPPFNQRTSCLDNVSQLLDDEKVVGAKRPWRFTAESTNSRDGKQIKSLDHRLKNQFQDSGTTIRNPITIDSSSSSSSATPIIQKEKLDHQFMPRRSVTNISSNIKPFYSFLTVNEQNIHDQDLSFSLKTDRFDTVTDHGIDLRLKL